jgi:hypothetical protein
VGIRSGGFIDLVDSSSLPLQLASTVRLTYPPAVAGVVVISDQANTLIPAMTARPAIAPLVVTE